ncbi:unnamed protein product [Zymoseptoria tritici ST99CH_1A5]|uniref:Zn(2)-C6 fungal-type domain-containing protein n=1 Tax=Zymoseptoria tritici ST99CH_1A5 TaxID=1276529 RepID=A0A1Y6M0I3_ZYMTR|nr:unnamed protein product [Zymoseptoria tritici ST99CH_1A5]
MNQPPSSSDARHQAAIPNNHATRQSTNGGRPTPPPEKLEPRLQAEKDAPQTQLPISTGDPTDIKTCHGAANLAHRVNKLRTKNGVGCLTCRTRKKTCDGAKPHCKRCERDAYVCPGYVRYRYVLRSPRRPNAVQAILEGMAQFRL